MSNKVIINDLASGPNISLPLQKKICMMNPIKEENSGKR
jgi:hypothetical protein